MPFVCKLHNNIDSLDMFSDCITTSVSGILMQVEDEELIEGSTVQRRFKNNVGTSSTEQPLTPNYVEYKGKFYHIAYFLSL